MMTLWYGIAWDMIIFWLQNSLMIDNCVMSMMAVICSNSNINCAFMKSKGGSISMKSSISWKVELADFATHAARGLKRQNTGFLRQRQHLFYHMAAG